MRTRLLFLLPLISLFLSGCAEQRTATDPALWHRTELYFGLSRRTAAEVSPEEWRAFVLAEVVPAFPGGFTELTAEGFFSQDGKSQHEPVRVLVILNPPEQAASANQRLDAIGRAYCNRFGQDAVLRADGESHLTFLRGQ